MTTNVTISTNHVMSPRKLRVRSVDPKNEATVYREIIVSAEDVKLGAPNVHGHPFVTLETLYVHDGSKIIIEEVE